MSKVKIQGNASGSGVFTLTTPNSSTDRTITLPDGTGTLAFTTGDDDKLPLAGGAMTGLLSNTVNVSRAANGIRSNATNLLVENTHASGAAGLRLKGGSGEASIIYGENNATDKLYFIPRNDTGKQVVIDHVGKVGIGTNAPNRMLTVESDGGEPDIALVNLDNTNNNSNNIRFLSVGSDDSTRRVGAEIKGIYTTHNATNPTTDLSFETRNASGALAERLRIMSDGKLRVGTANNGTITSTYALALDPPSGEPILFRNNGTDIARFRPGGGLCFGTDTAAANALDDYEEGTFTITISGSSSGSGTVTGNAYYTKIGRLCTVSVNFNNQTVPTISGALQIGLPFAAGNVGEYHGADIYFYPLSKWTVGTDFTGLIPHVAGSNSHHTFMAKNLNADRQSNLSSGTNGSFSGASGMYARYSITYVTA